MGATGIEPLHGSVEGPTNFIFSQTAKNVQEVVSATIDHELQSYLMKPDT